MKGILYWYDCINDIRVHVLGNYFLTILLYTWIAFSFSTSWRITSMCFFSAGIAYLYNRYTDYHYDIYVDDIQTKIPRYLYAVLAAMCAMGAFMILIQDTRLWVVPAIGAGMGFIYSSGILGSGPIKNILYVKNIFAALSKAAVLVFVFGHLTSMSTLDVIIISFSAFCVHLAYEILWDIRDVVSDRKGGVSTIANTFGASQALLAASVVAVIGLLLSVLFRDIHMKIVMTYMILGGFITILATIPRSSPRVYHAAVYAGIISKCIVIAYYFYVV